MPTFTFGPILEGHYGKLATLQQQAYPHAYSGSEEEKRHFEEQFRVLDLSEDLTYYGAYEDKELVGAMMVLKFEINFHGHMTQALGIASVAVDLIHKKRGIAKELILFSLALAEAERCPIFTLYPFNPKFYLHFGFGFGSPIYRYKLPPHCFKSGLDSLALTHSALNEPKAILTLYEAVLQNTHGMMNKSTLDIRRLSLLKNIHLLTVSDDNQIVGYMIYEQKNLMPDVYPLKQKLIVHEMLYTTPKALASFCNFFSIQQDQVDFIELTTFNPDFHHVLDDVHFTPQPELLPLIGHKASDRGHGLMYRALDPAYLLSKLPTKPEDHIVFYVQFPRENEPHLFTLNQSKEAPIELYLTLNHFSSWIMGAVSLWSLYELGQLGTHTPQHLKDFDHAFNLEQPTCITRF
jgi:predicted acetyltransferase